MEIRENLWLQAENPSNIQETQLSENDLQRAITSLKDFAKTNIHEEAEVYKDFQVAIQSMERLANDLVNYRMGTIYYIPSWIEMVKKRIEDTEHPVSDLEFQLIKEKVSMLSEYDCKKAGKEINDYSIIYTDESYLKNLIGSLRNHFGFD